MVATSQGFVAILVSGLLQGTMLVPMKYLRKWKWENTWLVYATFAYLLLPWIFAFATLPQLLGVYDAVPVSAIVRTASFGFAWGCAAVLFGIGIDLLGLALGYAIILGLGTSVGSLIPLVTLHRDQVWNPAGVGSMGGVLMLITSVVFLSAAGKKREAIQESTSQRATGDTRIPTNIKGRFVKGLVACILCGLLNPCLNFALAYGAEIQNQATRLGANPVYGANAIWVVVANAGFIPNLLYCAYLLKSHSSWNVFTQGTISYWLLAPAMGLMWISGTVFYGIGANLTGALGPVIGWPLLMCSMILTATFWGFFAGEWRGVRGSPIRWMSLGLVFLIGAILVLGWSSRLR